VRRIQDAREEEWNKNNALQNEKYLLFITLFSTNQMNFTYYSTVFTVI